MRNLVLADQRGITLMEVLIAVVILSIGLVALSGAIPLAAYGIQEGNQLSTATFLANQRLEQVRNALWQAGPPCLDNVGVSASASAAPTQSCNGTGVTFADESAIAAPYTAYSRIVRISDCGVAPGCGGVTDAGLRQATVVVSYRPMTGSGVAAAGQVKSAVVTMYLARR